MFQFSVVVKYILHTSQSSEYFGHHTCRVISCSQLPISNFGNCHQLLQPYLVFLRDATKLLESEDVLHGVLKTELGVCRECGVRHGVKSLVGVKAAQVLRQDGEITDDFFGVLAMDDVEIVDDLHVGDRLSIKGGRERIED